MVPSRCGRHRVWEGLRSVAAQGDALSSLVGRTRAVILQRLCVPMSTTQLARDLQQSPSTVNQHLTVLRDGGLLTSWRSGRSVLYRKTTLAASIVAACDVRDSRRRGA
jgi:DNA-binding transcriptional ArsR family regulator